MLSTYDTRYLLIQCASNVAIHNDWGFPPPSEMLTGRRIYNIKTNNVKIRAH